MVAGTDDHAYGQQPCRNLGKNNKNKAVKNADNIGYVAENYPALECNTAPAPPTDPPSRAPTKAPVACDGLLLTVKTITSEIGCILVGVPSQTFCSYNYPCL